MNDGRFSMPQLSVSRVATFLDAVARSAPGACICLLSLLVVPLMGCNQRAPQVPSDWPPRPLLGETLTLDTGDAMNNDVVDRLGVRLRALGSAQGCRPVLAIAEKGYTRYTETANFATTDLLLYMGCLFPKGDATPDQTLFAQMLERFESTPEDDAREWATAFSEILPEEVVEPNMGLTVVVLLVNLKAGSYLGGWDRDDVLAIRAAWMLTRLDPLFEAHSNRHLAAEGQRHLARLRAIPEKCVDLWVKRVPGFDKPYGHYDACLNMVMVDELYRNEQFNERRFRELLRVSPRVRIGDDGQGDGDTDLTDGSGEIVGEAAAPETTTTEEIDAEEDDLAQTRQRALALVDEGMATKRNGDYQSALVSFREATKIAPSCVEAHWGLAWVLAKLGLSEEAIEEFEKVIELDGGSERNEAAQEAIERLQETQ